MHSCLQQMEESDTSPWCRAPGGSGERTSCTADQAAVGSCNLVEYTEDLPEIYQNFLSSGRLGSSVTLADFCPYVQEFTWQGEGAERGTRCEDSTNAPSPDTNYALESFSERSRCFRQGGQWEQRSCTMIKQWTRWGSGCYRHHCSAGLLHITVGEVSYSCHRAGQQLPVQLLRGSWLHSGSVVCPACSQLCTDCSREGRALQDHKDKRQQLGDCSLQPAEESSDNNLYGFLREFGLQDVGGR